MQFIKFKGISELTREVVVTLVDRIYVYEDKRIRIEFNYRNEIAAYQEIFQEAPAGYPFMSKKQDKQEERAKEVV